MTNEEEQITLNIDLYDNIMTEKEGDYTGRPRITGTLYNCLLYTSDAADD